MTKQTVLAVIKRKNILYILYKRDFVDFAIHDIGHVQAQNACGCSLKKKTEVCHFCSPIHLFAYPIATSTSFVRLAFIPNFSVRKYI